MAASHLYRDAGLEPKLTGLYISLPSPVIPEALPEKYKSDKRIVSWEHLRSAPIFGKYAAQFFASEYSLRPSDLYFAPSKCLSTSADYLQKITPPPPLVLFAHHYSSQPAMPTYHQCTSKWPDLTCREIMRFFMKRS
jgi:hypothetical protein